MTVLDLSQGYVVVYFRQEVIFIFHSSLQLSTDKFHVKRSLLFVFKQVIKYLIDFGMLIKFNSLITTCIFLNCILQQRQQRCSVDPCHISIPGYKFMYMYNFRNTFLGTIKVSIIWKRKS